MDSSEAATPRRSIRQGFVGAGAQAAVERSAAQLEARINGSKRWEARREQGTAGRCIAGKGLGIGIEMVKGSSRGERENIGKEIAGRDRPENGNEWEWQNKEKKDWTIRIGFNDSIEREPRNSVYFNENRRREGERAGNTVHWEFKKG